jgi:hypothetical protein
MSLIAYQIDSFQNDAFQTSKWYDIVNSTGTSWSALNPGATDVWGAIVPTPSSSWTAIPISGSSGWVDIATGVGSWTPIDTSN